MDLPKDMLSVSVHATDPVTTTIDRVAIPQHIAPDHVLVKVYAAASNPKDWMYVSIPLKGEQTPRPWNTGDDFAGVVVKTGPEVTNVAVGDRVAAFHEMGTLFGSYAEYAVAPAHTTFKIPDTMSFAEASTIGLVSLTAALALFRRQNFVPPWDIDAAKKNADLPLIIYGASAAVGVFAIKMAKLAGIGPIVAIGGGSSQYVRSLLGDSDVFVDYRIGMTDVKKTVKAALEAKGLEARNGVDAVTANGSWVDLSQMLNRGTVSVFSRRYQYDEHEIPSDVKIAYIFVGSGHLGSYLPGSPKQPSVDDARGDVDFARRFFQWVEMMLKDNLYTGHPFQVVSGGLGGVQEGLQSLQAGRAEGQKFVYQIVKDRG